MHGREQEGVAGEGTIDRIAHGYTLQAGQGDQDVAGTVGIGVIVQHVGRCDRGFAVGGQHDRGVLAASELALSEGSFRTGKEKGRQEEAQEGSDDDRGALVCSVSRRECRVRPAGGEQKVPKFHGMVVGFLG